MTGKEQKAAAEKRLDDLEFANKATIERLIVDYFEAAGCDVIEDGIEWFLSLYDEGPAISLTVLALAISSREHRT
jgi:hypothetical protein